MMIPTISIDVVSMPVTRDGTNLLSNMPLGEVASQVLEQGAAFEAAVEQFQQIMAEFQPTEIGESAPIPLQTEEEGSDKSVASPNVPLVETSPAAPTTGVPPAVSSAGTSPAAPTTGTVSATELGTSPISVVSNAPTKIVEAAPMPLQTEQVGSDKRVFSPNEPSMETSLLDVEGPPDVPVLHAAPVVASAQPQVIDVKDVAVEPVQVVAARVAHQVETTPAQVLIEAASAVADTIVVSPGLLRGAGEVQVQLRPDVLEGTVIQISTTASGALTVQFTPVTEKMAELLEKCAPQLVTYLSERIHSVQIAVNVKRDEKLKG